MARFHLDHNVDLGLIAALDTLGHDAVSARALQLPRASDIVHLLRATSDNRILITRNVKDFQLLHETWLRLAARWSVAEQHFGIILIPQAWPPERAAEEIESVLAQDEDISGELWQWSTAAGWQPYEPVAAPAP